MIALIVIAFISGLSLGLFVLLGVVHHIGSLVSLLPGPGPSRAWPLTFGGTMNEHTEHHEGEPEPVMIHQHDDLSFCITFGDSAGVTLGELVMSLMQGTEPNAVIDCVSVTYFSDSDDCEGQAFPDEHHMSGVINIQTEPELCPEHAAQNSAEAVISEAENITKDTS